MVSRVSSGRVFQKIHAWVASVHVRLKQRSRLVLPIATQEPETKKETPARLCSAAMCAFLLFFFVSFLVTPSVCLRRVVVVIISSSTVFYLHVIGHSCSSLVDGGSHFFFAWLLGD